jgi:hypothetical protein
MTNFDLHDEQTVNGLRKNAHGIPEICIDGHGKFRLLAANENRKRKFVVLGGQTINSNRRLLFQQMCLSIVVTATDQSMS